MNSTEKAYLGGERWLSHFYWELIAQACSEGMRGGIKNVIKIRAQLFCVEGWGREMQKKARLDLSEASEEQERRRRRPWTAARAGPSAESLEDRKAPLRGVSTKLKNNDTPRENLMPIPVIKTHILHCFAFNFCFFSSSLCLWLSPSLFPPHCCFLVCFPPVLLWLSPSATATFKGSAVTRRLWVPFEILTYMLSGCRQEWLTGPSQSNTGLGRLAVFCQRQPRRGNKGKEQRRKKHT